MEVSYKYTESAVADSQQGVALKLRGWVGAKIPPPPNLSSVTKYWRQPPTRIHSLVQPTHRKMDTGFRMWNIRSLYSTGLLKKVARVTEA
jgi:hypothetical protein